jgi:hypothetical protein
MRIAASICPGRRCLGVPHRRRPVFRHPSRRKRSSQAVARSARSAGDHRLSPAGDARRDRGYRGVQTSKGTLDVLMEAGWVRFRGRRRTPGRPVTLGTHARLPRPFRPGGAARSSGPGRAEGGRAAVRPHPGQFQHSRAADERRADRGRGSDHADGSRRTWPSGARRRVGGIVPLCLCFATPSQRKQCAGSRLFDCGWLVMPRAIP